MHIGHGYSLFQVLRWTRHNIFKSFYIGLIPVLLYQLLDLKWLALPWTVVALLGTATAFIIGFRNSQTYNRTWEARQIWGAITNLSRTWATMSKNWIDDASVSKLLVYRHLAWLTNLRYNMREVRAWETMNKAHNIEWQEKIFSVPEYESSLEDELKKYISHEEINYLKNVNNKSAQLLNLQSGALSDLFNAEKLDNFRFLEMQLMIKNLFEVQGKSERIKNFPYPRQFATVNKFLVEIFIFLLPFCMLGEFDKLNSSVLGMLNGYMVFLVVPFSMLISWVFTSLDQIGESTENPFEGSAHDVPISQISRMIEIDMKEMLGDDNLPGPLTPRNRIIL